MSINPTHDAFYKITMNDISYITKCISINTTSYSNNEFLFITEDNTWVLYSYQNTGGTHDYSAQLCVATDQITSGTVKVTKVDVKDVLDPNNLDLSTYSGTELRLGSTTITEAQLQALLAMLS